MSPQYNRRVIASVSLREDKLDMLLTGPAPSDIRTDIWPQKSGCFEPLATDTRLCILSEFRVENGKPDTTLGYNIIMIDLTVEGTDCPVFHIH